MNDPWGSFQNFMTGFRQMACDPAGYVMQRFGIPKEISNNPNAIIQRMMQEGKVSQNQYEAARRAADRIQNSPFFRQWMK